MIPSNPDPEAVLRLARHSLAVIRAGQDAGGAYLAAPTFPTYRFSWFRDGAFIADAMSRVGDIDSAERFFDWCARVLLDRRERVRAIVAAARSAPDVAPGDHLHTRYHVDGTESSGPWENHQLDGYGAWLWALGAHAERHDRSAVRWSAAAAISADYVAALHRLPCYDWWEEHREQRHPSTLAAVRAGLVAVGRLSGVPDATRRAAQAAADDIERAVRQDGTRQGYVPKWLGSDAVDASLIAVSTPFGLLAPHEPLMQATAARVERDLLHDGGVHRYLADVYYGGGEWPILSALVGWHRARAGDRDGALAQLAWIIRQATHEGDLPEQVAHHLLAPHTLRPWIERWGPSACPLLWSHAMFLTLATELGLVSPELGATPPVRPGRARGAA